MPCLPSTATSAPHVRLHLLGELALRGLTRRFRETNRFLDLLTL
jgi:hypothetical protein